MKRKQFAGLQLAALHTLRPLLAICLVLAALQVGGFCFYFFTGEELTPFVDIFDHYIMGNLFGFAIIAMTIFTMIDGFGKSGTRLFMRRLALTETQYGVLWSINSLACFMIIWCWEIVLILICNLIFQMNTDPAYWSHQSFFISCYNSPFLHTVIPMGDVIAWVSHLIVLAGLALTTGSGMVAHWRGEQAKLWIFAAVMSSQYLCLSSDGMDIVMAMVFFCIGGGAITMIWAVEDKV